MGLITYEVLSATGRNLLVKFTCEGIMAEVGVAVAENTAPDELDNAIRQYIPYEYFNDKLNPVPDDLFAGLVGKTGSVALSLTQEATGSAQINTGDKIVSFTEGGVMAFALDASALFDGFSVVIGKASPGDVRIFHFTEDVAPERMTPRMLFCDEFDYLGIRVSPGTMTQDLPARLQGDWPMSPVRQDRDSYYFNSFRATWNGEYCDQPAVETKKVILLAGESYGVEHNAAAMLASGTVTVRRVGEQVTATAPMIIDARLGDVIIDAVTDATLCEVWI